MLCRGTPAAVPTAAQPCWRSSKLCWGPGLQQILVYEMIYIPKLCLHQYRCTSCGVPPGAAAPPGAGGDNPAEPLMTVVTSLDPDVVCSYWYTCLVFHEHTGSLHSARNSERKSGAGRLSSASLLAHPPVGAALCLCMTCTRLCSRGSEQTAPWGSGAAFRAPHL
jgi:hypothetical protein